MSDIVMSVIRVGDLDADLYSAWIGLQRTNPDLNSPYFHPEFTKVVATVRSETEIAVLEMDGNIAGFFPFERLERQIGGPVGGIISDYHGLVSGPHLQVPANRLLKECDLICWNFDHLPVSQSSLFRFHTSVELSPKIDLSFGYEAYVREKRKEGSEQIKKLGNLIRRIERELGPLHFVGESTDLTAFNTTLRWKSEQYIQNGNDDLFVPGPIREVIDRIRGVRAEGFSGILSLLYAGDSLLAGHFGMRSSDVWHYWFPSYNRKFSKYSPGLILLLKMAEHAPKIGIRTVDLGKGMSPYKERLMNASSPLASGRVEALWKSMCRRKWSKMRAKVQRHVPMRIALQWLSR